MEKSKLKKPEAKIRATGLYNLSLENKRDASRTRDVSAAKIITATETQNPRYRPPVASKKNLPNRLFEISREKSLRNKLRIADTIDQISSSATFICNPKSQTILRQKMARDISQTQTLQISSYLSRESFQSRKNSHSSKENDRGRNRSRKKNNLIQELDISPNKSNHQVSELSPSVNEECRRLREDKRRDFNLKLKHTRENRNARENKSSYRVHECVAKSSNDADIKANLLRGAQYRSRRC